MKTSTVHRLVKTAMAACLLIPASSFVQASSYSQIVAQARADLNAGNTEQALTESQNAIAVNRMGWQAYVVAGGALQVQQQYDKAIDDFTKALQHAPDAKKRAMRGLLEKCMKAQIAAQPALVQVAPTPPASAPPPTTQQPAISAASDGPSYSETVQWIQGNIQRAGDPRMNWAKTYSDGLFTSSQRYSMQFDACNTLTVSIVHYAGNNNDHAHFQVDFVFPLASTAFTVAPPGIKDSELNLQLAKGGIVWHQNSFSDSDSQMQTGGTVPAHVTSLITNWKDFTDRAGTFWVHADYMNPGLSIPFNLVGAETIPPHMVGALNHLIELCKNHPELVPKSTF